MRYPYHVEFTRSVLPVTFLVSLITAGLMAFALHARANVPAQKPARPKPTPTPRRTLPKPVHGARGFDQFATRQPSARLIVGAATRGADSAGAHYERGEIAYAAGKYQQAVESFGEAVRLKGNWAEARYALALSLIEVEKPEAAIDEFKQVLKLKAKYDLMVLSNYNLGNTYLDLGKYKEAIDAYQQAIELNPDLSRPHNNLGLAYAASNQLAEALTEFKQAVQLKADYAEAHFNLGVAYLQLEKKDDAREQQRILMKLNSELASKLDSLIEK